MFDEPKTSLGQLDESERLWAFRFMKGESWENQFECLDEDEGNKPPEWLVNWSDSWQSEPVVTLDDIDPLVGEYLLIVDATNNEVWAGIHQGDDAVVFKQLPIQGPDPVPEKVCECFLGELKEIGNAPFYGRLTVDAPRWLPRDRMETFLRRRMRELGHNTMHDFPLEKWLQKQYGDRETTP